MWLQCSGISVPFAPTPIAPHPTNTAHSSKLRSSEYNGVRPHGENTFAVIPPRTSQPTIFFPFTITTFSCSDFRFPLSRHHPSTNFPNPHFSHLAAPTLLQPSPSPDLILPFTSDIQSSLSLLPSPASPPSDDSAPSSCAPSSLMLGRSLFSSFGNAWLNS